LGNIITFDLELKGFAREPVTLKWSVFEAETGRPVPGFTKKPAWPYESIQPQSDVGSKSRLEAWVPFPKSRHKSFKVAIGAYATLKGKQVLLDSKKVPINVPDKLASNQRLAQDVPPPIVQAGGPEPMPVRETKPRSMPLPP
jgi:hypothetical protein